MTPGRQEPDALAADLYAAFWARQPLPDAPPFAAQADAIRTMWAGIAADARRLIAESPR